MDTRKRLTRSPAEELRAALLAELNVLEDFHASALLAVKRAFEVVHVVTDDDLDDVWRRRNLNRDEIAMLRKGSQMIFPGVSVKVQRDPWGNRTKKKSGRRARR